MNVDYANNFLMVSGSGELWLISSVYPKVGLNVSWICDAHSYVTTAVQRSATYSLHWSIWFTDYMTFATNFVDSLFLA